MWRLARPGFPVSAGTNRRWGIRWPPVPVPGAETTTESLKPAVVGMTTDTLWPLVPQAGAGRQRPCYNPCDRSNQ